jgi:hypothetical protein
VTETRDRSGAGKRHTPSHTNTHTHTQTHRHTGIVCQGTAIAPSTNSPLAQYSHPHSGSTTSTTSSTSSSRRRSSSRSADAPIVIVRVHLAFNHKPRSFDVLPPAPSSFHASHHLFRNIYIHVCMCVCMYIYVCMYECMLCTCTYYALVIYILCLNIYRYITHTQTQRDMHLLPSLESDSCKGYRLTHVGCVFVCVCVCVCVCVYVCVCVCVIYYRRTRVSTRVSNTW